MAMTPSSMAAKIKAKLQAANPDLTPEGEAIINAALEALCDGIIEEIRENGAINMDAGDFSVLPGSFQDSTNAPITGLGQNAPFNLQGKIE
tara:strand:- start:28550 stop:28822 length:273 start_codon:yes stop_codon:yes gene_type:complete